MRLWLVAALLALAPSASAAPRDYDEDDEAQSDFWERALQPEREKYDEMIERALESERGGDRDGRKVAVGILRDAVRLAPDRPLAHWWLGRFAAKDADYRGCARSLAQALALDPKFQPPAVELPQEWAGAYEVSVCQARAGDFEEAIDGFKRILGEGPTTPQHLDVIHHRLGECYMALGRLDEAKAALKQALRLNAYSHDINFALGVAHDRDEETAEARDLIAATLERDPRAGALLSSQRVWIPADDVHYYLGLVYLVGNDSPRALYHFRRYLSGAGESPWARRARAHQEDAQTGAMAGRDVALKGSATFDPAKVTAIVGKADPEFQACLATTPDLLLKVHLTVVIAEKSERRGSERRTRDPELLSPFAGPSQPAGGVRVLVIEQAGLKSDALRAAVACVETAAGKIPLPKPAGSPGSYATAEFPVIRR